MSRIWLFLHLLGFTMWLGGGLAAMFAGIAAKREDRRGLGAVVRAQVAIYRTIIGPGALLVVLSGLVLTLAFVGPGGQYGMNVWLIVMQTSGALGALVVLFVVVPTASRLARLDPEGPNAGFFDELRNRLKVASMIGATLALIALVGGTMVR